MKNKRHPDPKRSEGEGSRLDETLTVRAEPVEARTENAVSAGLLLPARTPRFWPVVRLVASVTVFAFTLTSVLPSGWAGPSQETPTLRVKQVQEAKEEVKGGLEEALNEKTNKAQTFQRRLASATPPTIWDSRVSPAGGLEESGKIINRREFLKTNIAAAGGAMALSLTSQNQPGLQQENLPSAEPKTVPVTIEAIPPGKIYVNWKTGRVSVLEPTFRKTHDPYQPDMGKVIEEEFVRLGDAIQRVTGLKERPPTSFQEWVHQAKILRDRAYARARPRSFGPPEADVLNSDVVWEPWAIPSWEWPAFFAMMQKASGRVPRNEKDIVSRAYMETNGLFRADLPNELDAWLTRLLGPANEHGVRDRPDLGALGHGVEIVPLLGASLMAVAPQWARFMIRRLWEMGILRRPGPDGVVRLALDIEPQAIPEYETFSEEDKVQLWRNVLSIAEWAQTLLNVEFKRQSILGAQYAEVILFVPHFFFSLLKEHPNDLKLPPGVRLLDMDYSTDENKVVKHQMENQQLAAQTNGPLAESNKWGIVADFGRHEKAEDRQGSLYGQETRGRAIGEAVLKAVGSAKNFNREFVHNFSNHRWELESFLTYGEPGIPENERHNYELQNALSRVSESAAAIAIYLRGLSKEAPSRYPSLKNGHSLDEKAVGQLMDLLQRIASGAFDIRTLEAYAKSIMETYRGSRDFAKPTFHYDFDANALGPDVGSGGAVTLEGVSSRFGDLAQITEVRRIVTDPSRKGKSFHVRIARPHLLSEEGKPTLKLEYDEVNLPGEFVSEAEVVIDAEHSDRDGKVETYLSNHYNIYYVVTVKNPHKVLNDHGQEEANRYWFQGNVRGNFYTGLWFNPVQVESEALMLGAEGDKRPFSFELSHPDQQGQVLLKLEVGPDGKGQLPPQTQITESFALINVSRGKGEVIHSVGIFAPEEIRQVIEAKFLDEKLRAHLKQTLQKAHQHYSALTPESFRRNIAVEKQLSSADRVEDLVEGQAAALKEQSSITHLAVESSEFIEAVHRFQQIREDLLKGIKAENEFGVAVDRLHEDLEKTSWPRLTRLLETAHARGLEVVFVLDWKQAGKTWEDKMEFFQALTLLLETEKFWFATDKGIPEKIDLLSIRNAPTSAGDPRTSAETIPVAVILHDGQVPFVFLRKEGIAPIPIGNAGTPIPAARQVQAGTAAGILAELQQDHTALRTRRPIEGMAFLSFEQAQLFKNTHADVDALAKAIQEAATPAWLDWLLSSNLRFTPRVRQIVLDYLALRKTSGFRTGLGAPVAHIQRPHPANSFTAQYRVREDEKRVRSQQSALSSILKAVSVPLDSAQFPPFFDPARDVHLTGTKAGTPHSTSLEVVEMGHNPRVPGDPQGVAFAVIDSVIGAPALNDKQVSMEMVDDYWVAEVAGDQVHLKIRPYQVKVDGKPEQRWFLMAQKEGESDKRPLLNSEESWSVMIQDEDVAFKRGQGGSLLVLQKGRPIQEIKAVIQNGRPTWATRVGEAHVSLEEERGAQSGSTGNLVGRMTVGTQPPTSFTATRNKEAHFRFEQNGKTVHAQRDRPGYLTLWVGDRPSSLFLATRHRVIAVEGTQIHLQRNGLGEVDLWEEGRREPAIQLILPRAPQEVATGQFESRRGQSVAASLSGRTGELVLRVDDRIVYADGRPVVLNAGKQAQEEIGGRAVVFREREGHRTVEVDGQLLHLLQNAKGDLRFWQEGDSQPRDPQIEKTKISSGDVVRQTVRLKNGVEIVIAMEGRYGLISLEFEGHTIQLWEIRNQLAWSRYDGTLLGMQNDAVLNKVTPRAPVVDLNSHMDKPVPFWMDAFRYVLRGGVILLTLGLASRLFERKSELAKLDRANAKSEAGRPSSKPRPAAGPIHPPTRIFRAVWAVATMVFTWAALSGRILLKIPFILATPFADWVPVVGPYIQAILWGAVTLFALFQVASAIGTFREKDRDFQVNPGASRKGWVKDVLVPARESFFENSGFLLFGVAAIGLLFGAWGVAVAGWPLLWLFSIPLAAHAIHKVLVASAPVYYPDLPVWFKRPLEWLSKLGWLTWIGVAGTLAIGPIRLIWTGLKTLGGTEWFELVSRVPPTLFTAIVIGAVLVVGLAGGMTALWEVWQSHQLPPGHLPPTRSQDQRVFFGSILRRPMVPMAVVTIVGLAFGIVPGVMAFLTWRAGLALYEAVIAEVQRVRTVNGPKNGWRSVLFLASFLNAFVRGWGVPVGVVIGLIGAFYGWPAVAGLASETVVPPLAAFLAGLTGWQALQVFAAFIVAGGIAEAARTVLVSLPFGFVRRAVRVVGYLFGIGVNREPLTQAQKNHPSNLSLRRENDVVNALDNWSTASSRKVQRLLGSDMGRSVTALFGGTALAGLFALFSNLRMISFLFMATGVLAKAAAVIIVVSYAIFITFALVQKVLKPAAIRAGMWVAAAPIATSHWTSWFSVPFANWALDHMEPRLRDFLARESYIEARGGLRQRSSDAEAFFHSPEGLRVLAAVNPNYLLSQSYGSLAELLSAAHAQSEQDRVAATMAYQVHFVETYWLPAVDRAGGWNNGRRAEIRDAVDQLLRGVTQPAYTLRLTLEETDAILKEVTVLRGEEEAARAFTALSLPERSQLVRPIQTRKNGRPAVSPVTTPSSYQTWVQEVLQWVADERIGEAMPRRLQQAIDLLDHLQQAASVRRSSKDQNNLSARKEQLEEIQRKLNDGRMSVNSLSDLETIAVALRNTLGASRGIARELSSSFAETFFHSPEGLRVLAAANPSYPLSQSYGSLAELLSATHAQSEQDRVAATMAYQVHFVKTYGRWDHLRILNALLRWGTRVHQVVSQPLSFVNGFVQKQQAADVMNQLDFGARYGAAWYAWTRREMIRRMKMDDSIVGIFPAIYVFPEWDIDYFTYGLGLFGIPFLFFSQFIQYSASMTMRWMRGQEEHMNLIHPVLGYVSSEMEPRFFAMINEVQGRWIVGHLYVLFNVYHGRFLHFDGDALVPSGYDRTEGGLWGGIRTLLNRGDDLSRAAAFYAAFPDIRNLLYGVGEQGQVSHLMRRSWNDRPQEGGPGGNDEEAFHGGRFSAGEFGVRLIGAQTEAVVYTPFSADIRIDGNGRAVSSDLPGKWAVRYVRNPETSGTDWADTYYTKGPDESSLDPVPQTAKSFRMSAVWAAFHGVIQTRPEIDDRGAITWVATSAHQELEPEVESARQEVEADWHLQRDQHRRMYLEMADWLGSDNRLYRRGEPTPAGVIPLGPTLGRDPHREGYGRFMQWVYWLGNIVTLRPWGTQQATPANIMMGFGLLAVAGLVGWFLSPLAAGLILLAAAVIHPVPRVGIARFIYGTNLSLWAGLYILFGLLLGWVSFPFALLVGVGLVLISPSMMEALILDIIPIAFWGFRQIGVIEGIKAFYEPQDVLDLTRRAVGGMVRHSLRIEDPGYRALLGRGNKLLRGNSSLEEAVINLATAISKEQYLSAPTRPATSWERQFIRRIRSEIRRYRGDDRRALQQVILHFIQGHHLAVGEEAVRYLHAGSNDPGVSNLGPGNLPFPKFRDLQEGQGLLQVQELSARLGVPHVPTRSWSWTNEATGVGGVRVPSIDKNPVEAYLNSKSLLDITEWFLEHSRMQPDADALARVSARRSREAIQEAAQRARVLRPAWSRVFRSIGKMVVGVLGGVAAAVAAAYFLPTLGLPVLAVIGALSFIGGMGLLRTIPIGHALEDISPELEYSGVLHPGDNPNHLMWLDDILYRVSHWMDASGTHRGGWWSGVVRLAGVTGVLGVGTGLAWLAVTFLATAALPEIVVIGGAILIGVLVLTSSLESVVAGGPWGFLRLLASAGVGIGAALSVAFLFPTLTLPVLIVVGVIGFSTALFALRSLIEGRLASLNRMIGFFGALGIGRALGWGVFALFIPLGFPLWGGVVVAGMIGLVSVLAALSSLFHQRLDNWVDDGPRGDGIRAWSLIPGMLLKLPLWIVGMKVLHTMKFNLPYSKDAERVAAYLRERYRRQLAAQGLPAEEVERRVQAQDIRPASLFMGLVHNLDWPMLFGWGFFPGMPVGRFTWWIRSATNWHTTAIPYLRVLELSYEPPDSRILSFFNYLPSEALSLRLNLAEDTYLGIVLAFANALAPVTPAASIHRFNHLLYRYEEIRDDADSLQRAMQFRKGMGMALAAQRMQRGFSLAELVNDFRTLSFEEQLQAFAAAMPAAKAYERPEVSMGGATGLGVHSYLFTSLTSRRMAGRIPGMVGMYAPGEIEALLLYLMYEKLDVMFGGALARQMEQMNLDVGTLSGGRRIRPGETLENVEVKERLFQGDKIDPRMAFAAAKVGIYNWVVTHVGSDEKLQSLARRAGEAMAKVKSPDEKVKAFKNSGYGRLLRSVTRDPKYIEPLRDVAEARDITAFKARTVGSMDLFRWSWGAKPILRAVDSYRHYRMVNDELRRHGKTRLIVLNHERVINQVKLVRRVNIGAQPVHQDARHFPQPFRNSPRYPVGTRALLAEEAATSAPEISPPPSLPGLSGTMTDVIEEIIRMNRAGRGEDPEFEKAVRDLDPDALVRLLREEFPESAPPEMRGDPSSESPRSGLEEREKEGERKDLQVIRDRLREIHEGMTTAEEQRKSLEETNRQLTQQLQERHQEMRRQTEAAKRTQEKAEAERDQARQAAAQALEREQALVAQRDAAQGQYAGVSQRLEQALQDQRGGQADADRRVAEAQDAARKSREDLSRLEAQLRLAQGTALVARRTAQAAEDRAGAAEELAWRVEEERRLRAAAEQKAAAAETARKEAEDRMKQAEKDLAVAGRKEQELTAQRDAVQQQYADALLKLKEANRAQQAGKAGADRQITEAQKEVQQLKDVLTQLSVQLQSSVGEVSAARERAKAAEASAETAREDARLAKEEKEAALQELERERELREQLEKTVRQAHAERDQANARLEHARKELEAAAKKEQKLTAQRDAAQQRIADVETGRKEAEARLMKAAEEAGRQAAEAQDAVRKLQEDLTRLEAQLRLAQGTALVARQAAQAAEEQARAAEESARQAEVRLSEARQREAQVLQRIEEESRLRAEMESARDQLAAELRTVLAELRSLGSLMADKEQAAANRIAAMQRAAEETERGFRQADGQVADLRIQLSRGQQGAALLALALQEAEEARTTVTARLTQVLSELEMLRNSMTKQEQAAADRIAAAERGAEQAEAKLREAGERVAQLQQENKAVRQEDEASLVAKHFGEMADFGKRHEKLKKENKGLREDKERLLEQANLLKAKLETARAQTAASSSAPAITTPVAVEKIPGGYQMVKGRLGPWVVEGAALSDIGGQRDLIDAHQVMLLGPAQSPDKLVAVVARGTADGKLGNMTPGQEAVSWTTKYMLEEADSTQPYEKQIGEILRKTGETLDRFPIPMDAAQVFLLVVEDQAIIGRVGYSSRAYIYRGGRLEQPALDDGSHIHTRVVKLQLQPGDQLLLVTQGVTDQLPDEVIQTVLSFYEKQPIVEPTAVVETLIKLATQRNRNNATAFWLRVQAAGMEEKPAAAAAAITELGRFAGALHEGNPSPDQYGTLTRAVHAVTVATPSGDPIPVETAWTAQSFLGELEGSTQDPAIAAIRTVQGISASTQTPEEVFLADTPPAIPFGALLAKAAPVAFVADTITVAAGLEELLKASGIPEGRYAVVAMEAFGGDREAAMRELARRFPSGVEFQRLPAHAGMEEIDRFLREHGVILYSDIAAGMEEVDRHLRTLA